MLLAAVILLIGLPAVVIDYRSQRVPNALVGPALIVACFFHAGFGGVAALQGVALGALAGLACLLPFHLLGAIGAGDVKLMAAMGALLGPGGAVTAFAIALVVGGVLALATLGWRRFDEFDLDLDATAVEGSVRGLGNRMPYAAAIVAGSLVAAVVA